MDKVASVLADMNLDFTSYSRIAEESFGSEVYLVELKNLQIVLKFSNDSTKFWRELKTIDYLCEHFAVPTILSLKEPQEGMHGALLMQKIPGRPMSANQMTPRLAQQCGTLLGKLHSIPMGKLGYFHKDGFEKIPFNNWWEYRKNLVLGPWTQAIESTVDQDFLSKAKKFLNSHYDSSPVSSNCFIHCDFRPGNVMADGNEVTGLIDFESARTGDPAYDFIKFYEEIGSKQDLWQSFLNGYSKIKALPELEKSLSYYLFELNYGFLRWALGRSDHKLFNERLVAAKSLLG